MNVEDDWKILPHRRRSLKLVQVNDKPNLYVHRLPIDKTKFKHLQELKELLPKDVHSFYDQLPT